jgi:6-phosphogluconolactonase (cycloisomerase 2 family)
MLRHGAELIPVPVETLPGASDVGTVGWPHPTEPWLYMLSKDGNHIFGYEIDAASGGVHAVAGSPIAALPPQTPADADAALSYLMVDQNGRYLYVTRFPRSTPGPESVLAFAIDQVTGALSAISSHIL